MNSIPVGLLECGTHYCTCQFPNSPTPKTKQQNWPKLTKEAQQKLVQCDKTVLCCVCLLRNGCHSLVQASADQNKPTPCRLAELNLPLSG